MAIHCYGEEVQDVNIVNDSLKVKNSITGNVNVTGAVKIGNTGGEKIPVDVSINNQASQQTTEDDLVLSIALQLYTYTNFDSIKNLSKHAGLCLERANAFAEVYTKFKSKDAIVDATRPTDAKFYVQYKPGDSYVDITIVDVSERFMQELRDAGAFLLGFESYNKNGHESRGRRKYKVLTTNGIGFDDDFNSNGFTVTESYIIFNADTFNREVLNKTFSIKIPDVWNERAYNGVKDNIKKDPENTTPWIYKPIKIRPTFRSFKTGWQHANLNIINYKWLTFEYPY